MTEEAAGRLERRLLATARREDVAVPPAWLEALEQRRPIPEWDAFLPDLVPDPVCLLAHLPPDALIAWDEELSLGERAAAVLRDAEAEADREPDVAPLFPPAADRWIAWDDFRRQARSWPGIALTPFALPPRGSAAGDAPPLVREIPTTGVESYRGRITGFLEDLDRWRREGERVVLVARSEAQGRRLQEILRDHDLGARLGRELPEPGGIGLWIGDLTAGFRIESLRLALITEGEIFGAHAVVRRRARPKEALPF
ncbi:MAG: mfd, partial [candidate division NC10 bacterium]|nr:mfd [candidate division NC10 bacterium]